MRNKVADGLTVQVTSPTGGYTAGDFVGLTNMVGVVRETTAASTETTLEVEGVFSVTTKKAAAGDAWAVGDVVYLTATGDFTETATGNTPAGVAWAAAATGDTTGRIRINFGVNFV